jgi:hypothetical protein
MLASRSGAMKNLIDAFNKKYPKDQCGSLFEVVPVADDHVIDYDASERGRDDNRQRIIKIKAQS